MATRWRPSTWGEEISLEYGKALRGYDTTRGRYRVFGSNGPIGWTAEPLAPGPGVILGRKGAYRGVQYSADPFFVIDTAYYVVPKTDLDMRWLYYAIKHYRLGEVDDGSPIPSTTRAAVYVMDLDVPPLSEQLAIAHILGSLEDRIELNRQRSQTLEALARDLFHSWFIDLDPVRSMAKDTDTGTPKPLAEYVASASAGSDLGAIPDGWELRSLDEVAHFLNGLAMQKYPPGDGPALPVIKISQLRSGSTIGADAASADLDPDYIVSDGDVLFSWSGSLECHIWTGGKGALNQHLFKVTSTVFPKWFYYLWIHHHLEAFRHIAAGKATTMGHIQRHHLSDATVLVPPPPTLDRADAYIAPLIEASWSTRLASRTLGHIRDTLQPKLMSGVLRINDAARIVERAAG